MVTVSFNGSNFLGAEGQSSAQINSSWRRNPFHFNNFITMQETK